MTVAFQLPKPAERLADVARAIKAGTLLPYLGPDLIALSGGTVPATPEALAAELGKRVPLPSRIRTNMWSAAQFIEQRKHRKTLVALMADIFAVSVRPSALHAALARAKPSLIVDSWYDGAMAAALRTEGVAFGEIQGITRALEWGDVWVKAYDAAGTEVSQSAASAWPTVLYKPHGSIVPAKNFLVADSDYVEVLTEIDIQTPIPDAVKRQRSERRFLFLGCRFHDQMLRTFARQIAKRSAGPHFALIGGEEPTRNELKFLAEIGATPLALAPADLVAALNS